MGWPRRAALTALRGRFVEGPVRPGLTNRFFLQGGFEPGSPVRWSDEFQLSKNNRPPLFFVNVALKDLKHARVKSFCFANIYGRPWKWLHLKNLAV